GVHEPVLLLAGIVVPAGALERRRLALGGLVNVDRMHAGLETVQVDRDEHAVRRLRQLGGADRLVLRVDQVDGGGGRSGRRRAGVGLCEEYGGESDQDHGGLLGEAAFLLFPFDFDDRALHLPGRTSDPDRIALALAEQRLPQRRLVTDAARPQLLASYNLIL